MSVVSNNPPLTAQEHPMFQHTKTMDLKLIGIEMNFEPCVEKKKRRNVSQAKVVVCVCVCVLVCVGVEDDLSRTRK